MKVGVVALPCLSWQMLMKPSSSITMLEQTKPLLNKP